MIRLYVDAAARELAHKSLAAIQRETALTWAARAVAAYRFFGQDKRLSWLLDAEEYAHESLEHAALSGDADLSAFVSIAVARARAKAVLE